MSPSGSGTSSVTKAKKDLQDYGFMEWLNPYQASRKSSTNLVLHEFDLADTYENERNSSTDDKSVATHEELNEKPEVKEPEALKQRKYTGKQVSKNLRSKEIELISGMETIIKDVLKPRQ